MTIRLPLAAMAAALVGGLLAGNAAASGSTTATTSTATVRVDVTAEPGPLKDFVTIRAYREDAKGRLQASGVGNVARRDDETTGSTMITGLRPGRYAFKIESGDGGRNHAETWYPYAGTERAAQRFTLVAGQELVLDAMRAGPPSSLTVKVLSPARKAARAEVSLYDSTGREVWAHPTIRRTSTTFHGLPAGRYRVKLVERDKTGGYVQWHPSGKRFAQARDVVVGEGRQQTVSTRLQHKTIKNTKRPRLSRDATTLTVKRGKWSPKPSRYTYTWYRNGKRMKNSFNDFVMRNKDRRQRFKVCVTAHRKGVAERRVCTRTARMPSRW